MKPRYWETNEFKKIEKKYNDFLKKSDFKDAEITKNGQRVLAQWGCPRQNYWNAKRTAKYIYFETLSEKTNTHRFFNKTDELVLTLRSEGKAIREIISTLRDVGIKKHRETIRFIIRRYEHIWKIHNWTLKQRNLKKEPPIK